MEKRHLWIYQCSSYLEIIRQQLAANRHERGYQSKLADAAGCQPSYMSQALAGKVMLTPDHAAALASFWEFTIDETEFFLTLLAMERAGGKAIKRHLRCKLDLLRDEGLNQTRALSSHLQGMDLNLYYSHWAYSAVHIAVSIPTLQTPRRLSQRLNLPLTTIDTVLHDLHNMGLVRQTEHNTWTITEKNLHLDTGSPLNAIHHLTWRLRAQDAFIQKSKRKGLHYTAVHSMGMSDFLKVRNQVNEMIESTRTLIQDSPEEELVGLHVDFYKI